MLREQTSGTHMQLRSQDKLFQKLESKFFCRTAAGSRPAVYHLMRRRKHAISLRCAFWRPSAVTQGAGAREFEVLPPGGLAFRSRAARHKDGSDSSAALAETSFLNKSRRALTGELFRVPPAESAGNEFPIMAPETLARCSCHGAGLVVTISTTVRHLLAVMRSVS